VCFKVPRNNTKLFGGWGWLEDAGSTAKRFAVDHTARDYDSPSRIVTGAGAGKRIGYFNASSNEEVGRYVNGSINCFHKVYGPHGYGIANSSASGNSISNANANVDQNLTALCSLSGNLEDQPWDATGAVMTINFGKEMSEQSYVYHHGSYRKNYGGIGGAHYRPENVMSRITLMKEKAGGDSRTGNGGDSSSSGDSDFGGSTSSGGNSPKSLLFFSNPCIGGTSCKQWWRGKRGNCNKRDYKYVPPYRRSPDGVTCDRPRSLGAKEVAGFEVVEDAGNLEKKNLKWYEEL
jgi:hypothetical protein